MCGNSAAIDYVAMLCGIEVLDFRMEKLFARLILKCWKHHKFKKEDFAIGHALEAFERFENKKFQSLKIGI